MNECFSYYSVLQKSLPFLAKTCRVRRNAQIVSVKCRNTIMTDEKEKIENLKRKATQRQKKERKSFLKRLKEKIERLRKQDPNIYPFF